MNIIKLKDVIAPDSLPWADYFNKHLKGKYAYWIRMKYIVSFDHMNHGSYVACEGNIENLQGVPLIDMDDLSILPFIDNMETDRINSTIDLRMKNKYVTDEDITIDELKKFRTWLSSEILLMDQTVEGKPKYMYLSNTDMHILNYYKNSMYDETIKVLTEFGQKEVSYMDSLTKSPCGCSGNVSTLYGTTMTECDPISIYRNNIYNGMVDMFSNIEFWLQWSPEFIGVFKRYIDNIINVNLPFNTSKLDAVFSDCGCGGSTLQDDAISILKRLSTSLEYIMNNDVTGHKNYINDSLREWSSSLYEIMEW